MPARATNCAALVLTHQHQPAQCWNHLQPVRSNPQRRAGGEAFRKVALLRHKHRQAVRPRFQGRNW
jgi:hypothetical protein